MTRGGGRRRRRSFATQIDDWNNANPIGSPVIVERDDGTTLATTTRSAALSLNGHTPVIFVDGIAGCYLLDRVTPRELAPAAAEIAVDWPAPASRLRIASVEIEIEGDPAAVSEVLKAAAEALRRR